MEFYLSTFGLHNPFINSKLPDHAIFPIASELSNGLDLDYTSLLIGEKYYIDEAAFNYVLSKEKKFLLPMAKTLVLLQEEGLIETVNVKSLVAQNEKQLLKKVDHLVDNYMPWLLIMREQWKQIKNSYQDFHNNFGSQENTFLNTSYFPIVNYLNQIGESDNFVKYAELLKLIESNKKVFSIKEIQYIKDIAKPLLAQLLINDLLRSKKNSPILNWDDSKAYYEQLYSYQWQQTGEDNTSLIKGVRTLFDVVVPSLKPKNIEQVVRFIKNDKAVNSLRGELLLCINNNVEISEKWLLEYLNKVFLHDLEVKSKMKKFKWLGVAISSFLPGGGALLQDLAMEVGQTLIEDQISDKVEDKMHERFNWYYALQKDLLDHK
ncbi:hypothetical protein [Fibrella arboris]|uniref:hypothetical protein n=1 Tax=Fibrella arboris TaxID=3242486 RepID=UPI00352182A4